MSVILALVVAASTPWYVDDFTNNNTGRRQVSSMQISDNEIGYGDLPRALLSLWCRDGKPTFNLIWPSSFSGQFVPVVFDWQASSEGRPVVWDVAEYSVERKAADAPPGETQRLVMSIPDGQQFYVTAHNGSERKRATFTSIGLRKAYDRVQASCAANPDGLKD